MMESRFPAEVQAVFKNMETNGTPWAFSPSERANWAEGLNIKTLAEAGSANDLDVLLWVGCAGAYDDRSKLNSRFSVPKRPAPEMPHDESVTNICFRPSPRPMSKP
jgi:hypothetical protein